MDLYCHIHLRYRRNDDTDLLLVGTPEDIAQQLSNHISSVLSRPSELTSELTQIVLTPVPPHQVWDLHKNPPLKS